MRAGYLKYFGFASIVFLLTLLLISSGCYRKRPSDKPPIHLNPNMDRQEKYKPQSESRFFEDRSTMRQPVDGTVARGYLREDVEYYEGKNARGKFINKAPIEIDMNRMERGQERYNIYCSPCHSRVGDGRGIMIDKGYLPPPSFHTDRIREMPDGQIYDVITNGVRNMPAYRHQINPDDRWAIVVYVRALQRSRNATINDIPEEMRDKIK
ncbi:MAG: cytochrome c [Candidatus Zixiibacteriota bacterium]|nr:MAG: cytochrome c [candidate division Zixibacteria bacterium]